MVGLNQYVNKLRLVKNRLDGVKTDWIGIKTGTDGSNQYVNMSTLVKNSMVGVKTGWVGTKTGRIRNFKTSIGCE